MTCKLCASCRSRVRSDCVTKASTLTNARACKAWASEQVWIGPSEARYHTVYQSVDKLPNGCFFLFFSFFFHQATTFPRARGFTVRGSSQVRLTTLFIRSSRCLRSRSRPGCHQSGRVKLKQCRCRQTEWQTDSERRPLAALRQPTRERADGAPSPPRNARGLIRVLSITFRAKFFLTFKPGWSPAHCHSPLSILWQVLRIKSSGEWQHKSTSKDYNWVGIEGAICNV